jgi:hypothetical protein
MATSEFCSFYKRAIEQQIYQEFEGYYHEEKKWIKIILHPGDDGVTAFFRDVTEVKKNEEQFELQKNKRVKKLRLQLLRLRKKKGRK